MAYPTKRTDALVDEVLEAIAEGETLAAVCRREGMPNRRTWTQWCYDDPNLAKRYQTAREAGEEAIADDCLAIADDSANDYVQTDKGLAFNAENVQRSKLRVHTRLQLLAKWNPKKWGERTTLAGDPDAPLQGLTEAQVEARLAELLAKGQG